jgi:putative transposase
MDFYAPLISGNYYHIYNRGNNGENLFYKHENYLYFLRQFNYYLNDYLDTFAYCLLPNHFHLLIRIKEFEHFPSLTDLESVATDERLSRFQNTSMAIEGRDSIPQRDGISQPQMISRQFRKLFLSYAQAINKQQNRTGSLFQKNFKRKQVENEHYFSRLVYYIHSNPQQHEIHPDFTTYPYSSYESLLSDKPTRLHRDETLAWFGNRESYRNFHSQLKHDSAINKWIIEE